MPGPGCTKNRMHGCMLRWGLGARMGLCVGGEGAKARAAGELKANYKRNTQDWAEMVYRGRWACAMAAGGG